MSSGGVAIQEDFSLRVPVVASVALHAAAAAMFLLARPSDRPPMPPTYRVNLIAAAPAQPQVGVVAPTPVAPVETPPAPTPAPRARTTPEPERMTLPAKKVPPTIAPKVATPNAATTVTKTPPQAPVAGGGPIGGKGADVTNVKVDGVEFNYPVYLTNVVRQIALEFKPSTRGSLHADVSFVIRRDGSIFGLTLVNKSGVFSFDQDALAAVETGSKRFGPLPPGFSDDALPIIFSFDPRLFH